MLTTCQLDIHVTIKFYYFLLHSVLCTADRILLAGVDIVCHPVQTWLLQPCLGGDAKMLMVANVAPTADAAAESLCSLRFAAKVNATHIGTARRAVSYTK